MKKILFYMILVIAPYYPIKSNIQNLGTALEAIENSFPKLEENLTEALFKAVLEKDIQGITTTLKNGANINAQESRLGNTPLHIAILQATTEKEFATHQKIILLLLKHGADSTRKNSMNPSRLPKDMNSNKAILKLLPQP